MEYLDQFTQDFFNLVFVFFLIYVITSLALDLIADFFNTIKKIGNKND